MQLKSYSKLFLFVLTTIVFVGCEPAEVVKKGDLLNIEYKPVAKTVKVPAGFPILENPADNPLTEEGVQLGRMLFYDPILSADSTKGCFSCHAQEKFFTDGGATSIGIDGIPGKRSSMSIVDGAFHHNGFFWDGRVKSLEQQAEKPVEDVVELHFTWPGVEQRLKRSKIYPELFRKAFGITDRSEITKDLAVKAIAQFERTVMSSGTSKYDRVQAGDDYFDNDEFDGYTMFFDLGESNPLLPDAECAHCHNEPLFTTATFFNNGLQDAPNLKSFKDLGLGAVTRDTFDNGKMKAPTLRNLKFTAPYMHDGSLKTIDDVLNHYSTGGHYSPNKDPLIKKIHLDENQKRKIKAFLNTLTDTVVLQNPAYSNPFK